MDIKIGMNMLLRGVETTPEKIPVFEGLAKVGFDGVEIPLVEQSQAQLKEMAAACDSLGLQRTASAFVGLEENPIFPDPAIRATAVDNLKRAVDDANVWRNAFTSEQDLYQNGIQFIREHLNG